jgi:hypothetical protein
MAELIKTDGSVALVEPQNGKRFTLEELQSYVGGYIEVVPVPPWDGSRLAVCDEEGKLKDKPLNELATLYSQRNNFGDVAVGDWLFVDRAEIEDDEDEDDEEQEFADYFGDDDEDEDDEDLPV